MGWVLCQLSHPSAMSTVRMRLSGSQCTVRLLPRTGGGADRPRELPCHSYRQRFGPEWPRRTRHYLRQRHSFREETTRSTGQTSRPTPLRTTSTSLLHQLLTITRQEDPESQLSQQSLLSLS